MERLGHACFLLAGHDRGARVGYRLALDLPGGLVQLAVPDIMPTDCGHYLAENAPEEITRALLDFFAPPVSP